MSPTLTHSPSAFAPPASRITPWGTGHAILVAEEAVTGPFAAINVDNFYGASSFGLLADYLQVAKDQDMATYAMVGLCYGTPFLNSEVSLGRSAA